MVLIQELLYKSCDVLQGYSKDELVAKEISKLLLEMKEFSWWIGNLEETPLHNLYQVFGNIILKLVIGVFNCNFENDTIEKLIDELVE